MNKKQSLRAMRRQAEREQRAEKQRQAAILATKDLEERKRLLAKAMANSEKEARNQAVEYCFHSIYAAVLLAAQEVYGFGHKRAWRLLKRVDEIVCTALSSEEVIQEVWERMGLEINFREGVERIREVEEAQKKSRARSPGGEGSDQV